MVSSSQSVLKHLHSVSFFDLDNTLYKGQARYVILDFPVFLHLQGLFQTESLSQLENLKRLYASHTIGRSEFALKVVGAYYQGLTGESVNDIALAAEQFWNIKPDEKWFLYTHPLVELMHKNTVTVLVSGSPYEVLSVVYTKLGFDHLFATKGLVAGGLYTGSYLLRDEMATYDAKIKLMQRLFKQMDVDPEKSFAFGDSESDIPLLQAVSPQNSFLIGGDAKSNKLSMQNGWNLLGHEDNVFVRVKARVDEVFSET